MKPASVIRPTDDEARALAQSLMGDARHAALAVRHPETGDPFVTRIGFGLCRNGGPVTLISSLSVHTVALRAYSGCSVLVGEPGDRGDPLTHPRLTLTARAAFVDRDSADHTSLTADWLETHPKAQLYVGFADFAFVQFQITGAHLNGGFGRAFVLNLADLGLEVP